jgi:hypothetical protein
MNPLYILSLVFMTTISLAQTQPFERKVYDFSKIDPKTINKSQIDSALDSIYQTTTMDSLAQLSAYVRRHTYTPKYFAFFIGYEAGFASLGTLNKGVQLLGFPKFSETTNSIPWGIEIRGKHLLFNYGLVMGLKSSTSNSDYNIDLKTDFFGLGLGYDIVNLKRFQFYPQFALGFQYFDIEVTRKSAATDIIDVQGLVSGAGSTTASKTSFQLTYGLQADYHLVYNDESNGGIILAFRYGLTTNLSEGKFKINNKNSAFTTDDEIRKSFFSVALKFYIKNFN